MQTIDNKTTSDTYSNACTLSEIFESNGGFFSVTGADVFVQLQWGQQGTLEWTNEVHVPVGTGEIRPGTTGIRFRSWQSGKSAVVTAALAGHDEPPIVVGTPSTANVTGVPINFQHGGAAVGTEPTLNFVDGNGLLWTVTDDGPNTRVNVSATTGSLAHGTRAGSVSTTSATFAGGADLLAAAISFTADGTSDYEVIVTGPYWWNTNANEMMLHLNLDGADAGYLAIFDVPVVSTGAPLSARTPLLAPAAGAHTVNARLRLAAAAGTAHVDAAGGGANAERQLLISVAKL